MARDLTHLGPRTVSTDADTKGLRFTGVLVVDDQKSMIGRLSKLLRIRASCEGAVIVLKRRAGWRSGQIAAAWAGPQSSHWDTAYGVVALDEMIFSVKVFGEGPQGPWNRKSFHRRKACSNASMCWGKNLKTLAWSAYSSATSRYSP